MLSSGLLLFHVNNVFSMLNHCIIFYYYLKYQLNSTLVLPTTDIANRVTKLYLSSVQIYTIFMWPVQLHGGQPGAVVGEMHPDFRHATR